VNDSIRPAGRQQPRIIRASDPREEKPVIRIRGRRFGSRIGAAALAVGLGLVMAGPASAQDERLIERTGPPELDELETDANKDGIPDGWYNARDVSWIDQGGHIGPHFLRFQANAPGRPARISRAFGVDGRKAEAILLGAWVRQADVQVGDRNGAEPALLIQFYGEGLRTLSRGSLGPWTHTVGNRWTRVVKRIPVPPGSRDAIMSVGLMGATGTLDVDGLTVAIVPREGAATTNLIVNGDFELGDPAPAYWTVKDARRVFPGNDSTAALELTHARSFAMAGVALPVDRFDALDLTVTARCSGLRGADGTAATFFFLDRYGRPIPPLDGPVGGAVLSWSGSSGWQVARERVPVPPGSVRAVFQIMKSDASGSIRIDDLQVTAAPNAQDGTWTPFHAADETEDWLAVPASPAITAGSALDSSYLLLAPAGREGAVQVKDGRLTFGRGARARFLGVSLMPQTAFLEHERADALAERLARSGINLVRLGGLDMPLGPGISLFDDTRDDTREFDPEALARLDHLIAALKSRGIYFALELQSARRFRSGDGVAAPGLLPDGGGPAAMIDPAIGKLATAAAHALLDHENPETGLTLREDPALAWVTLAGEVSLFDQIDRADALPASYVKVLRDHAARAPGGFSGKRLGEWAEAEHSRQMADDLRHGKLRAPIAGVSHWRREPEFARAQAAEGLDLIDDRIYWAPTREWTSPEVRSMLWSREGGLAAFADIKRRTDRPYVLGQWCNQTFGAWSFPTEAADYLLGIYTAGVEDWDAIVRRGVFIYPVNWGDGPSGLIGGDDIFQLPEVLNASPHVLALLPHAASLFYRGLPARASAGRHPARAQRGAISGWDPARGRLVIDTPFTQALVGWSGGAPARLARLELATDNDFAVLAASSVGPEPIAETKRLLVTAVARVEPTGFSWVNSWKLSVADPGRPPFLQEPVRAQVTWRRKGNIRAFALNPSGERIGPAKLEPLPGGEGVVLILEGRTAGFHWELVAE
jgi:hypothetical protein